MSEHGPGPTAPAPAYRITAPGIYAITAEQHHADPAPTMSLSSTGAKTLVWECPAMFMWERENRVRKRAFDIGNAFHLLILEPELLAERTVTIQGYTKKGEPSEGYTTTEAKAQRDEAYAAGKIPLLAPEADMVRDMREVLWNDPIGRHAFVDGKPEQSIFWQDAEFDIWCRSRPDWIPANPRYLINLKSAASSHPDDIARAIWEWKYFQSSAWEMDAVQSVFGKRPDRYALLVQAKKPPYLVTPVWLDPDDLAYGQQCNRKARGIFAHCQQSGRWPSYRPDLNAPAQTIQVSLPVYARRKLEGMAEAGELEPPQIREEAA